jgi:hypothetical protein
MTDEMDDPFKCNWSKVRKRELRQLRLELPLIDAFEVSISTFVKNLRILSTEETGIFFEQCTDLNHYHYLPKYAKTLYKVLKKKRKRASNSIAFARSSSSSEA